MKHNNKNCTGCMKCALVCPGCAMVKEAIISEHDPATYSAKYIVPKCLMCWTTGDCEAAKVCESGCFEVVK